MADWHTKMERDLIKQFGGEPKRQYGPDGVMPDGDPVEVRLAKKESNDRFRLNQDTHQELLEEDGSYILDDVTDTIPPKEVSAETVDDRLEEDWYSDRGYRHQFLDTSFLDSL